MLRIRNLALMIVLVGAAVVIFAPRVGRVVAATPMKAGGCSSLVLALHPGLNPPFPNSHPVQVAPDAPRVPFSVSLPMYPRSSALTSLVAPVFPWYPADPYLQTAGAEYSTPDSPGKVKSWVMLAFLACGWRQHGSWTENATAFTSGVVWQSLSNPDVTAFISFGRGPSGETDIGYGVEAILLPPRPDQSYLHGPFTQLRIVLMRYSIVGSQTVPHVTYTTVVNGTAIQRLVNAINAIKGYRTASALCTGGLSLTGPAWLSFIRPNGAVVHAYESGPGGCGGGLAVNGVRWLTDSGVVWDQILLMASVPGK